jgi:Holliday junction resolvase YEN1
LKTVKVVRAQDIQQQLSLDPDGLVLFAMLVGGDYDTTGLRGCGPATALRAVKAGLGKTLCLCRTKQDCVIWRSSLLPFYKDVPLDFPDSKTLDKYNKPTISPDE